VHTISSATISQTLPLLLTKPKRSSLRQFDDDDDDKIIAQKSNVLIIDSSDKLIFMPPSA